VVRRRVLLLPFLLFPLLAQQRPSSCAECAAWNAPQPPFPVYGNTYFVGTHGLSSILIVSPSGHVLIDGALPESAPLIAAHIRALGFRVEDVKLIVNSHVHFDHAGGIAELQRLSGARVAGSRWTADVMRKGAVPRDDPQFGIIVPIAPIPRVEILQDGQTLTAGTVRLTAHLTPGHTPGGTSWTWTSCQGSRCLNMVYADSLSPVSADGFLFSRSPQVLDSFQRSYAFLDAAPCDILLTPHPDASHLWQRLDRRQSDPDALIDPGACRALAQAFRESLRQRMEKETRR
jgi:metallo-beta-lactamase class B